MDSLRRQWLAGLCSAAAGAALFCCKQVSRTQTTRERSDLESDEDGEKPGAEVTATEDLMREHGVLRRALLVYQESAGKTLSNSSAIDLEALQKTAKLFRAFGEEYHEKKLEEAYIFPALRKVGGQVVNYVDVLILQHERGREITNYILDVTTGTKLAARAGSLGRAMESFVRMYQHHAAIEDTVVFPAWKQVIGAKRLAEMGDKFEEIERQQFGEDGFEDAVKQIAAIEQSLGLADLSQFTAPPPLARV